MLTTRLFQDLPTDQMDAAVPSSLSYPSGGIASPFELLRLMAYATYKHQTDAIAQVQSYAETNKEYPYDDSVTIDPIKEFFFNIRPVGMIEAFRRPCAIIVFNRYQNGFYRTMTTPKGKDKLSAFSSIFYHLVSVEDDIDVQEIKLIRLAAAVEYIMYDLFLNNRAVRPAVAPYQYIEMDENVEWNVSPPADMGKGSFGRILTLAFSVRKLW